MIHKSTNGYVKWPTFILVVTICIGILGVIYTKVEKIDDKVGDMKADIAVIKQIVSDSFFERVSLIKDE